MRAQTYSHYGGPDVLELRRDLPEPRPGPHEVLIELRASAVNPIDWKVRKGNLRHVMRLSFPMIPGRDFCGVVLECGARATTLARGDEVFGLCPLRGPGSHADRVCVAESHVVRAPRRLHGFEAAAVPLVGLAAIEAVDAARLRGGERVLVQGGGGAVGSLAIQYARHLGARVWATSSTANLEHLRELGAEAIDYTRDRFEYQVPKLDVVLDCVGGEVERRSFEVIRRGGRVVTIAGPDPDAEINLRALASVGVGASARVLSQFARGRRYRFVSVRIDQRRLHRLAELVDEGVLHVRLDRSFDLSELAEAHRRSESGHARGKIVIDHHPGS